MPKHRGVRPATVRLPLSEGDWLDVRQWLTVGEERDIVALALRSVKADGSLEIDQHKLSFLTAAVYIQAWSLLDYEGRAIAWPLNLHIDKKIEILRALDVETMKEIEAALEAHRTGQQKNVQPGEVTGGPTSPSAS